MKTSCPNLSQVVIFVLILGALILWVKWPQWGRCMMSGDYTAQDGYFGDFFGGFNSLISVLGFGAVIYSLNKQRRESKETEERHRQTITKQQEMFSQDIKLRLFEMRVAVYKSLLDFVITRDNQHHIETTTLHSLLLATEHKLYLFPLGSSADKLISDIQDQGWELYCAHITPNFSFNRAIIDLQIHRDSLLVNQLFLDLSEATVKGSFQDHLRITEPS